MNVTELESALQEQRAAVQKYLEATGHDLCHDQRHDLAEAFGLEDMLPERPKTLCEFDRECKNYQRQLWGRAAVDDELYELEIRLSAVLSELVATRLDLHDVLNVVDSKSLETANFSRRSQDKFRVLEATAGRKLQFETEVRNLRLALASYQNAIQDWQAGSTIIMSGKEGTKRYVLVPLVDLLETNIQTGDLDEAHETLRRLKTAEEDVKRLTKYMECLDRKARHGCYAATCPTCDEAEEKE